MAIVKGTPSTSPAVPVVASPQVYGYGTTYSVLVRDVGSKIFLIDPSAAPFTLLTDRAGSKVAVNPKFEWYEKSLRTKMTQINGSHNDTTLSLTVDDAYVFQTNDIVLVPSTSELMLVTAVTSSTVITVSNRGLGSSTAATISDNADMWVVGSAWQEGVDVGTPDEWQEVHKFNYTQIFRRPFGASRTREASEFYFQKPRAQLRGEKGIEHAIDIELAFLFGVKAEVSSGNAVFRTTGGAIEFMTSNLKDMGGVQVTEPDFEDWMEDLFAHPGSAGNSRLVLASPLVISAIDQMAADRLQMVPSDKTYGIAVNQLITSHGTLNIVKHRLLKDGLLGGGAGYQDWALAVDVGQMVMRPLSGGSTRLLINRQAPGVDGWIDEYLSEVGLQFQGVENAGILKNVGSATV